MKQLTKAEEQVMQTVWGFEKAFLRELVEAMPAPKPHQNTVATLLKILVEKGFVQVTVFGRQHQYAPLISKEAYFKMAMKGLAKGYFGGSVLNALPFMVKENNVSVQDLEALLQQLKKKKMNPFLLYITKVVLCSGVLLGYYWIALRNRLFHQWNRFYLLICVLFSLIAPLITIYLNTANVQGPATVLRMLNVVNATGEAEVQSRTATAFAFSATQWLVSTYVLISIAVIVVVATNLVRVYAILRSYPKTKMDAIAFLNTDAKGSPFSFFHYIVWNCAIDLQTETGQRIFRHEMAHVQQRHTWDKLFLLLILIPFWINPFFWIIRKELSALHEFMADEKSVDANNSAALAQMILNSTFPQQHFLFTNPFFQSTIKRRIAMFTKLGNPKINYWSRIITLPVLLVVIASFALKTRPHAVNPFAAALDKPITVVIDAGHGGEESGAQLNGLHEKDLALAISKKIKEQNTNANVHIILTRESDLVTDLQSRVQLASDSKADLFLSIHINAADDALNQQVNTPQNGIQVVVSSKKPAYQKQSEMFGSLLVEALRKVHYTQPDLLKPNTGVWVIDQNSCPAVLIECGYLTDTKDRDFITNEENQRLVATKILDAIERYGILKNMGSTSFITDTTPQRIYKNKAVSDVQYFEGPKQEIHIVFADNTKDTVTYADAKAANLFDTADISVIERKPWTAKKETVIKLDEPSKPTTEFNGVVVLNGKLFKGKLTEIQPDNIESVNVLKDNDPTLKKYGKKAKNGVILITTKNYKNG